MLEGEVVIGMIRGFLQGRYILSFNQMSYYGIYRREDSN